MYVFSVVGFNLADFISGNSPEGNFWKSVFVLFPLLLIILHALGMFGHGPLGGHTVPLGQAIFSYAVAGLIIAFAVDYFNGGDVFEYIRSFFSDAE